MQVITTTGEMRAWRAALPWGSGPGLVPTMGYLHAGHLALVERAREENDLVAVSIFVNPTQFGQGEDLARYPRNLPRDLQMLEEAGVDVVFAPAHASEMYPPGFATYVEPVGSLANAGEGASRPGHFRGVATVVLKLFQILGPSRAYFGQKDAQQVAVIQRLTADLNAPVEIRVLPTIRESDGLAMSSRNAYLTPEQRAAAPVLFRALQAAQRLYEQAAAGSPTESVLAEARGIIAGEPLAELDYVEARSPETFEELETIQAPALLLIAARVGQTRLIDNLLLRPDGIWEIGRREEREVHYAR